MREIDRPLRAVRNRKGLQLNDRELQNLIRGGNYELIAGRDFTGSASTTRAQLMEAWRREHGKIEFEEIDGALRVYVTEPQP